MARSDTLEDESGKHTRAHEPATPFGIVAGGRLRGDDFVEGLALLFECRDLVTDGNQQVAVDRKLSFVGYGTMSRDDDLFARYFGEI